MRAALMLVVLLGACATRVVPPVPADAGLHDTGTDAGPIGPPIDVRTLSGSVGPLQMAPGAERTVCAVFDLGNDEPVRLRAIHTHLTAGTHHMIVSRADDETAPHDPTPCSPFSHGLRSTVFIAQSPEASLAYPNDSGLPLAAHQLIGLELHAINYFSSDTVDVTGMVELEVSDEDPRLRTVFVLFAGPLGFALPPHEMTHITFEQPFGVGTDLLAVTTHTHQLGTYASLRVVSSPEDPGQLIHESYSWSDPPLTVLDPPRSFPEAGWLRLECDFLNDRDDTVYFGESFDSEMCFFWAYYLSG